MQYLPYVFCMLVCPVGIGLMMWMGKRTGQEPSRPVKEPQPLPTTKRSQERQTPEGPSPMNMIVGCMKHCLNWKVLAGLAIVALAIGVVAPRWLSIALPTLLVLICPLSMLIIPIAMRFSNRNRGQKTVSCCTQSFVPSSELAPEPVAKTHRSEMPERDPVKY